MRLQENLQAERFLPQPALRLHTWCGVDRRRSQLRLPAPGPPANPAWTGSNRFSIRWAHVRGDKVADQKLFLRRVMGESFSAAPFASPGGGGLLCRHGLVVVVVVVSICC